MFHHVTLRLFGVFYTLVPVSLGTFAEFAKSEY
jgi:hypothetical protein